MNGMQEALAKAGLTGQSLAKVNNDFYSAESIELSVGSEDYFFNQLKRAVGSEKRKQFTRFVKAVLAAKPAHTHVLMKFYKQELPKAYKDKKTTFALLQSLEKSGVDFQERLKNSFFNLGKG